MWKEITEERYSRQLDFMMPTAMTDWGFLAGKVEDHNAAHQPRYVAFVKINGQFSNRPPLSPSTSSIP
jgi:hypothetical protein